MAIEESVHFRRLRKLVGKAIGDFSLIEAGDRIAVAVSGGKDSYVLLHLLESLRRRAPVRYELVAVNVDAGFPGYRQEVLAAHLQEHGFATRLQSTEMADIIDAKLRPGSSYCAFCARLRRGVLYSICADLGCNKLALGHHLDDFIETLLLNQFFVGKLAAMSPRMLADNGRQTVIRPLVYVEESAVAALASELQVPIIDCGCPVQGTEEQQRQRMKSLVGQLAQEIPQLRRSLLGAMGNVQPRHLLDLHLQPS